MNLKHAFLAAAALASSAAAASPAPVRCAGGQMEELACSQRQGRAFHELQIHRCRNSTYIAELKGPGPTDGAVTLMTTPVTKQVAQGRAGAPVHYGFAGKRGFRVDLTVNFTTAPVKGGHQGHFTWSRPGPTDKVETTSLDMVCNRAR